MPSCAAINCTNQQQKGTKQTFHTFPSSQPEVLQRWVINMHRKNFTPSKKSVVCSDHFDEQCFDRTGQTVRLRRGAIPTLFQLPEHLLKKSSENKEEDDKTNITKVDGDDCSTDTGEEDLRTDPVTPATAQGLAGSDYISNYQHQLTSKLFDFYKNNKFCDTVIDVQSKQQTSHKFYAHSVILAASNATLYEQLSSVVGSSLYMSNSLKPDIRFYIPIKDCDPVAVEISLRYIYTGQLVVPKSFSDETHMQSVLAACVSLGVPLSMLIGVQLVVQDNGENAGSSTVALGCQSQGTALVVGPSDHQLLDIKIECVESIEPDHQLLDVKIECDPDTDDVHNSSSNDFECPASALKDGVDQDCVGILKVVQSGTATSLEHVVNTAFTVSKQAHESASAKQILISTSNSDAIVAAVLQDHLYAVGTKKAPKPRSRQPVCNICGAVFYSDIEHQRHLRESHAFVCRTCGFRVMSAENLKRHEATHKTTPRYSCQPCGLTFKTDILYRSHRMKFHGNDTNSFLCHICGAIFTKNRTFIKHSNKHLPPYKCEKCGHRYARKSHLNEHLLSCLTGNKKPFMCDVCGASFATSSGLYPHLHLHRNHERLVCSECGKSYKHKRYLNRHSRVCHKGGATGLPAADKSIRSAPRYP